MNTQKAAYWFTLAALGLALHSAYRRGEFPILHRLVNRAGSELCRAATHAERTFAMARLFTTGIDRRFKADEFAARSQANLDRTMALREAGLNRVMALRQADLERMREQMERVRIVMDRAQLQRLRGLERMRVQVGDASGRDMVLVCPETGARIALGAEALPDLDVDIDSH